MKDNNVQSSKCIRKNLDAHKLQQDQQEYLSIDHTEDFFDTNMEVGEDQKYISSDNKPRKHSSLSKKTTYTKKRKYTHASKIANKVNNLENDEKLFIRVIKLNSAKLSHAEHNDKITTCEKIDTNQLPLVKPEFEPNMNECILKEPKVALKKNTLVHVNKTESIRLEELLLKKLNKTKEKQPLEDNQRQSLIEPESSFLGFEPYEYQKTEKSVYETYVQAAKANGDIDHCCLLCPFVGQSFHQISLHYKFKHKETPIEEMHFCNLRGCQFKTVHRAMLKWHMKRHVLLGNTLVSDEFSCSQCGKVFEHRKGLLIHLKHMHKEPSPQVLDFPCSTCKFRASTRRKLQLHIYKCHIPDRAKPKFTCNICGFETIYKDSFKKHLTNVHLKSN